MEQALDILNSYYENNGQFIPQEKHYTLASEVLKMENITKEQTDKAKWMQACVITKSKFMTVDADDVKYLLDTLKNHS